MFFTFLDFCDILENSVDKCAKGMISMDETISFSILEIEKTKEKQAIQDAYRRLLVKVNPEDDPEGFRKLREAYEQALSLLSEGEEEEKERRRWRRKRKRRM